jgi:hypothetical protein
MVVRSCRLISHPAALTVMLVTPVDFLHAVARSLAPMGHADE